ncbi:MAG TPA: hypothetical protein VED17_08945 [Nitrososphaerales archaeon]|nr:hypothetical protein [Nitrososphaerales archaeon]
MADRKGQTATDNTPPLFATSFASMVRLGLIISAIFGLYIFGFHPEILHDFTAIGLVAISIADLVLVLLMTLVSRLAAPVVVSSILTTTLLVGDLLTIRLSNATSYISLSLFGFVAFDALLMTQFLIGIVSLLTTRRSEIVPIESEESIQEREKSGE